MVQSTIFHGFQAIWRTQRPVPRKDQLWELTADGQLWNPACRSAGLGAAWAEVSVPHLKGRTSWAYHGNVMEMSCINWGKSSKNGGFVIEWVIERDFMVQNVFFWVQLGGLSWEDWPLQGGAPVCERNKLVQTAPISLGFMVELSVPRMVYKPTFTELQGHHLVELANCMSRFFDGKTASPSSRFTPSN